MNADQSELDRFNALAARWWDENSAFRPLHRINPHRLTWIDQLVGLAGKRALDVGCGGGILAESMARAGAQVTGIDLADKALRVAQAHAQTAGVGVQYVRSSAEHWAADNAEQYDKLTCMEMLEHVPSPDAVIGACARMVKPGGWVIFSTINRNPVSYLSAIIGVEYVLRVLPHGTHQYARFIKPVELLISAEGAGLQLREQRGLAYNPFTQRFWLNNFMGVGYLLAMQKPFVDDPDRKKGPQP